MKKKLIICRTCGYIMEADKPHDVCPACGVPSYAFEPYESNITPRRESILSLHLHPIILHFPQAAVVFALLLLAVIPFFSGELRTFFENSAAFNIFILPLSVLGGALSGALDGKLRFKSVTTPILKFKIALSCLFLVLTLAAAILLALNGLQDVYIMLVILTLLSTIIAVVLGRIGSSLTHAIFPG